jgi:hypothetical protein
MTAPEETVMEEPPADREQPEDESRTEEEMRALVSDWEKQKTEQARQKLGGDLSNPD